MNMEGKCSISTICTSLLERRSVLRSRLTRIEGSI
uniref:Uncharacterized protein n=1 Tax=virus sp. ct1Uu26 TaxID=2826789 RepID=A0A8S5R988_9VIRU|nr:MAG TPA: hypothetical protein [virus sp. ct1Uu26]